MRTTHCFSYVCDMVKYLKFFTKMVRCYAIYDGVVSLLRDDKGNAYEVIIRPAKYAKYINTKTGDRR